MRHYGWGVTLTIGLLALVAGCGGNGSPPDPGATVAYEAGNVRIEGSSGLQQVEIRSPTMSPVLFTGYYGAQITRLSQMGFERLAFSALRDDTALYDVCLINEDATGYARLTTWPYLESNPDYSPNGLKIAFDVNVAGNNEVYSMDADGTDIVRLTSMPNYDGQPAWSPDGTKIAFVSARTGDADIWVMNADGSGQTNLTALAASHQQAPSWSPDGRRIAHMSSAAGNDDIWVMNADGSYPTALTDDVATDQSPVWSPDGRTIAFSTNRSGGVYHIYTMNADGSNELVRSAGTENDCSPSYSPDGSRLAYIRGSDLVTQSVTATEPRAVCVGVGVAAGPVWCPAVGNVRALIGPVHSDGGSEPPFGSARPLAILGLSANGLVEAATVDVLATLWSSASMEGLESTGAALAGVRIEATQIDAVREDRGRGVPPRVWSTPSPTGTRLATVFFNVGSGRITTVLASSSTAITAASRAVASRPDGSLVVTGPFDGVWGEDPGRNLAPEGAARVALDADTGAVLGIER